MIIDNYLTLSGAWAAGVWTPQLVTATGNNVSTNVIDLASAKLNQAADYGQGNELDCVISVVSTLTSGGAATVSFQLVQADDAGITTNVNVLNQTDVFGFASIVAGMIITINLDRTILGVARRYMALRYVVGTAVLTNATGQFIAHLADETQDKGNTTIFQSGFAIA